MVVKKVAKKTVKKPAPHTQVEVARLPKCDFCGAPAKYDGRTGLGPWANMCEMCFHEYGTGLGLGKGQKLVLKKATVKRTVKKVAAKQEEGSEKGAVENPNGPGSYDQGFAQGVADYPDFKPPRELSNTVYGRGYTDAYDMLYYPEFEKEIKEKKRVKVKGERTRKAVRRSGSTSGIVEIRRK